MDRKVVLKVDGKEISMNYFVSEMFVNVIDGLVNSLDKIDIDKKKIEITIEKKVINNTVRTGTDWSMEDYR